MGSIRFTLNGKTRTVTAVPAAPLLGVPRLTAAARLMDRPWPTEADVERAFAGRIRRTDLRVRHAVRRATGGLGPAEGGT